MAKNEMKAKPALPERVRSMEGLGVAVCWRFLGSGWRCVAGDTKLVSIGISEVGAIVVLVIFGPQPRRTFELEELKRARSSLNLRVELPRLHGHI